MDLLVLDIWEKLPKIYDGGKLSKISKMCYK